MLQEAQNARVEADYGIKYMKAALSTDGRLDSRELSLALTRMEEGRSALGRYMLYSGAPNPYPQSANPDNEVIEPKVDLVEDGTVTVNADFSKVQHIKILRNGLTNMIDKVLTIRMSAMKTSNPKHQLMATQSLNRALDCFEASLNWLGAELGNIKAENPGTYPNELPAAEVPAEEEPKEEAVATDEIMEKRAEEVKAEAAPSPGPEATEEKAEELDPNRPYTGDDYLPGGRLHPDTPNNDLDKVKKEDPASPSVESDEQPTSTTPSS